MKNEKLKWRALSLANILTNQNVVLLHKGKTCGLSHLSEVQLQLLVAVVGRSVRGSIHV